MPYTRDAEGRLVWVDATPNRVAPTPGPAPNSTIRPELENRTDPNERTVQLVNNQTGAIFEVGESGVESALASGRFGVATPEQVAAYDRQQASSGFDSLKALAESAGAAGFDALTALPRAATALATSAGAIDEDPLKDMSGRQLIANLFALGGDTQYDERARERAEEHGVASAIGNIAGTLAGGFGVAGLAGKAGAAAQTATGSRAVGLGVSGAIEGGILGVGQASEQAYLEDTELTGERLLAGMGWGALVGGGVGMTIGGAGRLFRRSGSRGATPLDSPQGLPGPASDGALEATATRALGDGVTPVPGLGSKVREALEDAQAAVAGVDREALREVGATRGFLDPKSSAYRGRSLWWNRDQIWEGSTAKLTAELEQAAELADDVFDNVVDSGLKRERVAALLTGDKSKMTAAGWDELSRVKGELEGLAERAEEFGNGGLLKRRLQLLQQIEPKTAEAADAFISLDKTKRALQKDVVALRTSASRSGDALQQMQNRQLADALESIQERVRTGLEDSTLWGKAGDAQKSVNAAWGEHLRTQQPYRDSFLRRVESVDYQTGRPVYRVDPDKVASYIRKTGRQEGALVDEYFRRHIDARENLARTISEAYGVSAEEAAKLTAGTKSIKATLTGLDETARAVNQVQAIMEAEAGSGAAGFGAVLGGVLGGAPGAAAGAALGAVAKPGTMIRQAAAIEQLARNLDSKITKSLKAFFERASNVGAPRLPDGGALARGAARALPGLRSAPTVTALEAFRGREANNQKAYRKRAQEVLAASENFGEKIRGRAEEALGELPTQMPGVAGSVITRATVGAEFLKSKLPAPLVNAKSLTPNSRPPIVSDYEIAQFARYWSAVANPLSALEDLRRGTLSREQVEALRVVYPKLHLQIQNAVRTQLLELDEKGTPVSFQARLQLDLLLDLGGAGEPTASPDFMVRFAQYAQQQPAAASEQKPQPPARPINIAKRLRTGTDALDPTHQE